MPHAEWLVWPARLLIVLWLVAVGVEVGKRARDHTDSKM